MAGINEAVLGAIDTMIAQHVSATPMDLTVNAEVVKLKNPSTSEWLVKYENNTFSAFSQNTKLMYTAGEQVFVLVPQGNFSSKKIILGRASAQNNMTDTEIYEASNFYLPMSENWLGPTLYGQVNKDGEGKEYPGVSRLNLEICSCPRSERHALMHQKGANYTDYAFGRWPYQKRPEVMDGLPKGKNDIAYGDDVGYVDPPYFSHYHAEDNDPAVFPTPQVLKNCDEELMFLSNRYDLVWIGIKAKFRTEFMATHTTGTYGIRLEYLTANPKYVQYESGRVLTPDASKYVVKSIELTLDNFGGNPYALVSPTEVVGYFHVNRHEFMGLNRVCLFQNSDTETFQGTADMTIDYVPVYDENGNLTYSPDTEVRDRNNVFATDIDIRWYEKINLLDRDHWVWITSDQGHSVFNETNDHIGIPRVTLKAHLYFNGRDLLDESDAEDNYDVIWYRELPGARTTDAPQGDQESNDRLWKAFCGDGWAPIFRPEGVPFQDDLERNIKGIVWGGYYVEEVQPSVVNQYGQKVGPDVPYSYHLTSDGTWPPMSGGKYDPDDLKTNRDAEPYKIASFRELVVPRDRVAWMWRYSCAVVPKVKRENTIDNDGQVVEKKDVSTNYYFYQDGNNVTAGYEVWRRDSRYDMDLEIQDGVTLGGTRKRVRVVNKNDMSTLDAKPEPKAYWYANCHTAAAGSVMYTAFSNLTKEDYESGHTEQRNAFHDVNNIRGGYLNSTDDPAQIKKYPDRGFFDITDAASGSAMRLILGLIDPDYVDTQHDGIVDVGNGIRYANELIGVWNEVFTPPGKDFDVKWVGQTLFSYDGDGNAKDWYNKEGQTLKLVILSKKNTCPRIRLYGPGGLELEALDSENPNEGVELRTISGVQSMVQTAYLEATGTLSSSADSAAVIHFTVSQVYDQAMVNGDNTFYARVEMPDRTLGDPIPCPLSFVKDNGDGANGTGWNFFLAPVITEADPEADHRTPYRDQKTTEAPIVVERAAPGSPWVEMKDASGQPKHRVVIRPFIFKAGQGTGIRASGQKASDEKIIYGEFSDLPVEEGYWAEIEWDARWPDIDCPYTYNGMLRFVNPGDTAVVSASEYERKKKKFSAVLLDGNEQAVSTIVPRGQDKAFQGVCAYTHTHERVMDEDGTNDNVLKTYGAIDVRWNDALDVDPLLDGAAGMYFGKENFRPVIKATVKIYDGCYEQQGTAYRINPRASTKRWITTLTSYYPLDVFVRFADKCTGAKAGFEFDPRKVSLNWPKSVTYSAVGDRPVVSGELNDGLTFNYGEYKTKDEKRTDYVLRGSLYEGDAVVHDSPWYPAVWMTDNIKTPFEKGNINSNGDWDEETIQTQTQLWTSVEDIIDIKAPKGADGKFQTTQKRFQWVQKFEPDPRLCLNAYMQSVLHTDYKKYWDTLGNEKGIPDDYKSRTRIYDVSGEGGGVNPRPYDGDPFNECGVYIRTQYIIYRTNESTAINNWDGVSISLDTTHGAILAPMVAAGYKEPATNKFTGVVIGYDKMFRKDGIYGTERSEGDMRQFEATGGYDYFAQRYPYMAGVYGYQNEIPSFGLMENGTAFFGRADGGAQIVIDGTNAVLWGGGNGLLPGKQSIEDDMWNCMRITLMDLTKDASRKRIYSQGMTEAPDTEGMHTDVRFNLPMEYDPDTCPMGDNGWSSQASFVDYFRGINPKDSRTNRYAFPWWYEEIWKHCYRNDAGTTPWYLETATMYQKYAPDDTNYWDDGVWINTDGAWGQNPNKLAQVNDKNAPITTFRYSRASTTPAIEIGQHPTGLMPGIIPWCHSVDILRNLYIPGDRNFMVTYDGTMWAMNGVFLGNIIGSNFIGGRIQGCELGIGTNPSSRMPYAFQKVDECDWPPLMAPSFTWTSDPISDSFVQIGAELDCLPAMYADGAGNLSCASLHIYGGSIDIGTFHIRGKEHSMDSEGASKDDYGELIQYGKSDFIGLVHCYGNLGIGPNLNEGIECGSNYGHLTQIKGQVLLGIVYSEGDTTAHEKVANGLGMTKYSGKNASKLEYHGTNIEEGSTVQELAFFGIDARDTPSKDGDAYWGHFWPMFFRYSPEEDLKEGQEVFGSGDTEHMPGWFGTMEAFKSDAGVVPAACKGQGEKSPVGDGGNYFRVGPWGTESMYIFLRKEFQPEDECDLPVSNTYYGYIGVTERKGSAEGDAVTWAIGMSSWGRSPIIFNSDEAIALRAQYQVEIAANPTEPEEREGYDHVPKAAGWSSMVIGYYEDPEKSQSGKIFGQATKGMIGFTCPAEEAGDDANPLYAPKNYKPGDDCKGGITIKPYEKGAAQNGFWAWIGDDKEMHLMCGLKDNAPETAEIHLTKEHVGINAPEKFWVVINKGAHNESDGKPGLLISEDETKIGGSGGYIKMGDEISFEEGYADENNQKNIYARFA